jgi:hypothetical protein
MSYYHEARAHVKALKQMTEDNKRRQERRAELYEAQVCTDTAATYYFFDLIPILPHLGHSRTL